MASGDDPVASPITGAVSRLMVCATLRAASFPTSAADGWMITSMA